MKPNMTNSVEISVVIPVFNEESVIFEMHTRLCKVLETICKDFEIIFINDGSKDKTRDKIKHLSSMYPHVKYLGFSRNFGHQVAVSAGLEYATGNAVIIIDGDLQDPPELITQMYQKYREGYKVVNARRTIRKGESHAKKITAKLFYRTISFITDIDIPLDTGDYKIIDRVVVNKLLQMPETSKFLRGQIAWLGFKSTEVEFERKERGVGKSGYTYQKMLRFALDGITAFSNLPLKIATFFGIVFAGIAFITILYALYSKFILDNTIQGWTSLIISSMLLGGVQLICLGVIGEYISRMNLDIRSRPLYIIEETENIKNKT